MSEELFVGSERAEGYHCRRCGGPLVWVMARRWDPALGEATYRRSGVDFADTERRTPADREETVAAAGRDGPRTRTVWVRRLELVCPRCNTICSRQQAGQGDPRPEDMAQTRRIGG